MRRQLWQRASPRNRICTAIYIHLTAHSNEIYNTVSKLPNNGALSQGPLGQSAWGASCSRRGGRGGEASPPPPRSLGS